MTAARTAARNQAVKLPPPLAGEGSFGGDGLQTEMARRPARNQLMSPPYGVTFPDKRCTPKRPECEQCGATFSRGRSAKLMAWRARKWGKYRNSVAKVNGT